LKERKTNKQTLIYFT